MNKFIFYCPMDEINEIHLKKDIFEIPRGFASNNFHSAIISGRFDVEGEEKITFLSTNNVHKSSFFIFLELGKVIKIIHREKPEIFMFFHNNPYISIIVVISNVLRIFSGKTRGKTLWIIKTDWDGTKKLNETNISRLLRNLFFSFNAPFVDFITSESTCGVRALLKYVKKDKIILFPNSYSSKYIEKQYYDSTNRKPIILTVSRVAREKDLKLLLAAFANLKDMFKEWEVHIIGPIWDRRYYEELIDFIKNNNLDSRVTFFHMATDTFLKMEYSKASIFCLPSINESFGISRMEAVASGIPVITSDAGCGNDMEEYGMRVFKSGDAIELTNTLERFMSDEKLRRETAKIQSSRVRPFEEIVSEFVSKLGF